ncbi:hypothetical protein U9422_24685, partial [Escherichia coli]
KRQFGFVKARYKGLLKNDNQLAMLFTLANLFRVDQMIRQWERCKRRLSTVWSRIQDPVT